MGGLDAGYGQVRIEKHFAAAVAAAIVVAAVAAAASLPLLLACHETSKFVQYSDWNLP